ncbi:MAG: recombination mediator RecR [bacterium]
MLSPKIQRLIDLFSKLPTIGLRTSGRFVFYLLKQPKNEIDQLIKGLEDLKNEVKICSFCFNPFEGKSVLCPICSDKTRDTSQLCVVEKETDLIAIEQTHKYHGLYFILGGTVYRLREDDLKKLKTAPLLERIKNHKRLIIQSNGFSEIILAFNPTTDGQSTILYLERLMAGFFSKYGLKDIKISRLGLGLPVNGEMEYADDETLISALEGRK